MNQSQALLESIISALEHHNAKNKNVAHILYQPAVVVPLHDSFAWDEEEDEDDEEDEDFEDEDDDDFDWSDDEDEDDDDFDEDEEEEEDDEF